MALFGGFWRQAWQSRDHARVSSRVQQEETGADAGFSFRGGGGGGCKRLCACTHITSAKPEVPYGRGPGLLTGALLSRAIWALFLKHYDKKKWYIKYFVDPILGGRRLLRPPPPHGSATEKEGNDWKQYNAWLITHEEKRRNERTKRKKWRKRKTERKKERTKRKKWRKRKTEGKRKERKKKEMRNKKK